MLILIYVINILTTNRTVSIILTNPCSLAFLICDNNFFLFLTIQAFRRVKTAPRIPPTRPRRMAGTRMRMWIWIGSVTLKNWSPIEDGFYLLGQVKGLYRWNHRKRYVKMKSEKKWLISPKGYRETQMLI